MKKIILLVFVLVTVVDECYSQTASPNMHGWMAKYWFYRWRLRNDFMVMGEAGQSLVAEIRNPDRFSVIKWSDAMIMHGYYLSMLAIEHKLLSDAGRAEDLKNNERELYFAIKAFERVDYVSETFYSRQGNNFDAYRLNDQRLRPDVNGYFFRDDVPPDFINTTPDQFTNPHFTPNHTHLMSNKTGIDYHLGVDYSRSDYDGLWFHVDEIPSVNDGYLQPTIISNPKNPIVNYKKGRNDEIFGIGQESQDQVIRLLLGFFTIRRSISAGYHAIDKDGDGVTDEYMDFHKEAGRHATNIIGHMAGYWSGTVTIPVDVMHYSPYFSLQIPGNPTWTIYNPRELPVDIGNSVGIYMPPIQMVSTPLFSLDNDLDIINPFYASVGSLNVALNTAWNIGISSYNDANVKMTMILKVISNSGSTIPSVPRHIYNKTKPKHFHGFFIPLYDYFWGWYPSSKKNKNAKQECYDFAVDLLNAAPCIGPYNFGNLGKGMFSTNTEADGIPQYWNAPYIFDNSYDTWDDGIQSGGGIQEGWFSGVDYMFLHNLIYANSEGYKPLYHDLINRVVDYPVSANSSSDLYEYSAEGYLIGGFETLKIKNNITSDNVPIKCKALEYVQVDAGTIDPSNTSITIEVGKITCGTGNTNASTPYSISQCTSCGLEQQIGNAFAPFVQGRNWSLELPVREAVEDSQQVDYLWSEDQDTDYLDIQVYPNPVMDFFTLSSEAELVDLKLMDYNGLSVKSFDCKRTFFELTDVASGVYLLLIKNKNNETKMVKLVKL